MTQLALSFSYARFDREFAGTSEASDSDTPVLESNLTTLGLNHFFGDGWSGSLQLPVGSVKLESADQDATATRRLSGLGDISVAARYDFAGLWGAGGYSPSLTLQVELGLPSGRVARIGRATDTVPPSVLSVGSGAYSARGELRLTQFVHRYVGFVATVGAREPLGSTTDGIRFGTLGRGALEAIVRPTEVLLLRAGVDHYLRRSADSDENGRLVNSGGSVTALTASAGFRVSPMFSFGAFGRLPVAIDVRGRQLVESFSAGAALSFTFGAPDEHDHDHGDDHDHDHHDGDDHGHGDNDEPHEHVGGEAEDTPPPGDVQDAATGGSTFELKQQLAPGRFTVIDFWADWCEPCKVLNKDLRRLASEHADIAIRRVEVPDFDSPVAKQHLRGVTALPVVWIFDGQGRRIQTLSPASPASVVDEVENLVVEEHAH